MDTVYKFYLDDNGQLAVEQIEVNQNFDLREMSLDLNKIFFHYSNAYINKQGLPYHVTVACQIYLYTIYNPTGISDYESIMAKGIIEDNLKLHHIHIQY